MTSRSPRTFGARFSRRTLIRSTAIAAPALATAALIGCGDDDDATPTSSGGNASPTAGPSGAAISKAKPGERLAVAADTFFASTGQKSGGTFRYNSEYPGFTAEPNQAYQGDWVMSQMVYQRLYGMNWPSSATMLYLAQSVEEVDNLTWVVDLRSNAKFHPKPPVNGRAVTADDVKYSFDRVFADKTTLFNGWNSFIDKIEVVSPTRLRFTSKYPFSSRFDAISPLIVPQGIVEALGDLNKRGIGSGPFMYESDYDPTGVTSFNRHPEFAISGRPFPDKLEFRSIPDQAAQVSAFRSDQIDMVGRKLQKPVAETLTSSNGSMTEEAFIAQYYFGMKTSAKPFDDIRVRQALSLAIDRKEMMSKLEFGEAEASGTVPWGLSPWALPQKEINDFYKLDDYAANLAEAKKLVQAVGADALSEMELTYPNDLPVFASGGPLLAGMLRNAGFKARENPQPTTTVVRDYLFGAKFQLLWMQTGTVEEPYYWMQQAGSVEKVPGASFWFGSKDDQIDSAILAMLGEFDFNARVEKAKAAQRVIMPKYWNQVPVYSPKAFYVRKNYLKDYRPSGLLSAYIQSDMWLDK